MQTLYSKLALEEAEPERQMEALGSFLIENDPLRGLSIPQVPSFEAQTESEILMLTALMPDIPGYSAVEHTLNWIKASLPEAFEATIDIVGTNDLAQENQKPGFQWVGFDPLGITIEEDFDFRPDIFIGRPRGRYPTGLDLAGGTREPSELAGIEAFLALLTMPALTHEVWHDQIVILPRLEASNVGLMRGSLGAVSFNLLSRKHVHAYVNWWGSNYYGHLRAIPTLRELN